MVTGAGLESIATYFPSGIRANAFWGESAPAAPPDRPPRFRRVFDEEMWPYLGDPFFGAVERRVASAADSSVALGLAAAHRALAAAHVTPSDVDCLVSVSMFPDGIGSGDAGRLAQRLGHRGGAFSVEATCAGSLRALLLASGLVASGQCERVLVVVTALMTRAVEPADPGSRMCGDAAAAFLVVPREPGTGILGSAAAHTGETCGTWLLDAVPAGRGGQRVRLRTEPRIAHVLRSSAESALRTTATAALRRAGVALEDIRFFVFNAASAWHARASARVLGVDPGLTVDTFPRYGNIGPALMPVTAHTGALERGLRPDDLVLLYGFGGQAEAVAAVTRWGDVALGPPPADPAADTSAAPAADAPADRAARPAADPR